MRWTSALALLLALAGAAPSSALVLAVEPEAPGGTAAVSGPKAAKPSAPDGVVVKAKATASKPEVTIGEEFTVEVAVEAPAGTSFTFPAELVTENVELRSLARQSGPAGETPAPWPAGTHRYGALVYQLGEGTIPPLAVKYRRADGVEGEVSTEPLTVKVGSRLPKDTEQQKLADIRGPLALAIGPAFWIAVGVIAIAAATLVFWLVRRRRAPASPGAAMTVALGPDAEALQALSTLAASDILARHDYRGFYIALTGIAKRYLERRLGAPVLEMTTAEMVVYLRHSEKAADLVTPMRDLAGAADQIKFARGAGLVAEAERHLATVRGMVATLEARFAPPPAGEQQRVA